MGTLGKDPGEKKNSKKRRSPGDGGRKAILKRGYVLKEKEDVSGSAVTRHGEKVGHKGIPRNHGLGSSWGKKIFWVLEGRGKK